MRFDSYLDFRENNQRLCSKDRSNMKILILPFLIVLNILHMIFLSLIFHSTLEFAAVDALYFKKINYMHENSLCQSHFQIDTKCY